ncbi:MAG: hypothetical protein M1334_00750 [Patescibacteria group bacterium]|nr:hypothetical protein [Patescibacteria group bacterium]
MPKFEFPSEYFSEEKEENKRLNKPGEKKKFISIEDLPSDSLTPEEIAIAEEARLQKERGEALNSEEGHSVDSSREEDGFERIQIERSLNKEDEERQRLENTAGKILPKEILEKPSFNTALREQSTKERSAALNRKISRVLGKSRRNQGRKPEYKDKRSTDIPSESLAE